MQLNQNAPGILQERLWQRMSRLPHVITGQSTVSVSGARALFLDRKPRNGPDRFISGREFAHIHPFSDGSLHLILPQEIASEAIRQGWAEPHPLIAHGIVPSTVMMVYGPRDEDELEVVWSLIVASFQFARNAADKDAGRTGVNPSGASA